MPAVAVADLDRDGAPEIVVGDGSGNAHIFHNDGDGGFFDFTVTPVGKKIVAITTSDLDSDGDADILFTCVNAAERIAVLLNDGAGGMSLRKALPLARLGDLQPLPLLIGELNGDGQLDVISPERVNLKNRVSVLLSHP
jgi:hypothetical protein